MGADRIGLGPFDAHTGFCVDIHSDTVRGEARLRGTLDATTIHRLDEVVDHLLRSGCRYVVFDLAGLEFVAAAGLRVLIRADETFRAAGGSLTLANPPRMVRRILAITELDKTFTVR